MNAETKFSQHQGGEAPPKMKGGIPYIGHIFSFAPNPYKFVQRVHDEVGEIAQFTLFGKTMVLLTGEAASELFYRSPDEVLDQAPAYKMMTPVFGEGLVFDAPIDKKNEQLKMLMPSLRMEAMRSHSGKIVFEVEDLIKTLNDTGEVELVEFMKSLTINTASHCLLGREFRYELNEEFGQIYHDLEKGVNPLAFNFPNLPIPAFKKRNKARARLQELVGEIIEKRKSQKEKPDDMFQSLIDMCYQDGTKLTHNEITGMLIATVFAGHHTSSGTAAWLLIELLRHPHLLREVQQELDQLYGSDGEVTFESLRHVPKLENALKEVLRLHPPLIILMRQVQEDIHFKNYTIKKGMFVWATPPVTHRMGEYFPSPHTFDAERYCPHRAEDKNIMAYQPFGGGKHKCAGNNFAMFQIKAIFAVLLRRFRFELIDKPEDYVDDFTQMIVQPKSPCKIRYFKRDKSEFTSEKGNITQIIKPKKGCPAHQQNAEQTEEKSAAKAKVVRVAVDRQLCQGHAVCMGEAPQVFHVDDKSILHILKEVPDAEDMEAVQRAVKYCPNHALSLIEE